jgi:hypothetical protein
MSGVDFIVVTGMSGAGKSAASRCLEDLGFFCIDNLPAALIPKVAELCVQAEKRIERVALVIDAREGRFLDALFDILVDLRREGHQVRMVFLDGTTPRARFKEPPPAPAPRPDRPQGSALISPPRCIWQGHLPPIMPSHGPRVQAFRDLF